MSHNELGSPLVQSQVLPYLDGLRGFWIDFDLVTFERGATPPVSVAHSWHPIRSRAGSGLLAKASDILRGVLTVARLARTRGARVIHARSYVAAMVALVAGWLSRSPYIFDMRGFLGDEYVDVGYWSRSDLRYRAIRAAETLLLRRAAVIVVLTRVAERRIREERRFAAARRVPVRVIPCAVDLTRYRPAERPPDVATLVYSGSLGSFYRLDEMLLVYEAARSRLPGLRFAILNSKDSQLVADARRRLGIGGDVEVGGVPYAQMPEALRRCSVGIALVDQLPSKTGSSAIKVSEYLATGLPVVVSAGLGDTDVLVREHGAGHVVASYTREELSLAGDAVAALATDAVARANARRLAERAFDLGDAVRRYAEVYRIAAAGSGSTTGTPASAT